MAAHLPTPTRIWAMVRAQIVYIPWGVHIVLDVAEVYVRIWVVEGTLSFAEKDVHMEVRHIAHLPGMATHLPGMATHLPSMATHLSTHGSPPAKHGTTQP